MPERREDEQNYDSYNVTLQITIAQITDIMNVNKCLWRRVSALVDIVA